MRNGLTLGRVVTAILIVLLISVVKNWKDVKQGFVAGVNDGREQVAKEK